MNLTDRIYVAVHVALTILLCARYDLVAHWPWYIAWNAFAVAAIFLLARNKSNGAAWEFVHDWLPAIFFVSVFEEVSFLSLALRGAWQNPVLIAWESGLFAVSPAEWLRRYASLWFGELLEFGYLSFYPLYPVVGGVLWAWRGRPRFGAAFRRMTDALSVGYIICYTTYVLFPTRSPSHNAGIETATTSSSGGLFHFLVRLVQGTAGVHGNAFPAHISCWRSLCWCLRGATFRGRHHGFWSACY